MSAQEAVVPPEPVSREPVRLEGLNEQLTGSAVEAVGSTYAALGRTVTTITTDCRAIGETLASLNDALGVISPSGDGQAWSGFGLVGLPIMGALRAVRGLAGQYVKQETGVSLHDWTDLAATAARRFAAYVEVLEKLTTRVRGEGEGDDTELAAEDLDLLLDVQWRTKAWKELLSRVGKLGHLLDAILKVDLGGSDEAEQGGEASAGISGALKRFKDTAQSRVLDRSDDIHDWALRPFVEVRDRVQALPREVEGVAREVALLEILLDLAIAQLRARRGKLSEAEVRLVGLRVAAAVVLPELAQTLSDARRHATELEARLGRLVSAHDEGRVSDEVQARLLAEYERALTESRTRVSQLAAEADVWRTDGPPILDRCAREAQLELDVLTARGIVERDDTFSERRSLLARELQRLEEVRSLLVSL